MLSSVNLLKQGILLPQNFGRAFERSIHASAVSMRVQAGRYRPIVGRKQLLTYDMAHPPHFIAHKKAWNSWNTSTILGGKRVQLTTIEDMFIRRFLEGVWIGSILGRQMIIKRQHNLVRVAACIQRAMSCQQMYFLIGFSEEMLSIWLQCPVKLELQTVSNSDGYVKIV